MASGGVGLWIVGEREENFGTVMGVLRGLWECVKIIMGCFRKGPKARKGKHQGKGKKGLVDCRQVAGQHTYLTDSYA